LEEKVWQIGTLNSGGFRGVARGAVALLPTISGNTKD